MLTELRGFCEDGERWVVNLGIVSSLSHAQTSNAALGFTRSAL
jgi:hypothetical protein